MKKNKVTEIPSVMTIKNKHCKGEQPPLGVELPGGFAFKIKSTIKVDLRKAKADVYYPIEYRESRAYAVKHSDIYPYYLSKYTPGVMNENGVPVCYNIPIKPMFDLNMPPLVVLSEEKELQALKAGTPYQDFYDVITTNKNWSEFYTLFKKFGMYRAIHAGRPPGAEPMFRERDIESAFSFENPFNNPSYVEKMYNSLINNLGSPYKTYESMGLSDKEIKVVTEMADRYQKIIEKGPVLSEYATGMSPEEYAGWEWEIFENFVADAADTVMDMRMKGRERNIPAIVKETGLPYDVMYIYARYLGHKRIFRAVLNSLDYIFDVSQPTEWSSVGNKHPYYQVLPENHNPWIAFRHRLTQISRYGQKDSETYSTIVEGVPFTFVFDAEMNEDLAGMVQGETGPMFKMSIGYLDRELVRRPNENYIFRSSKSRKPPSLVVQVNIPSPIGLGKEIDSAVAEQVKLRSAIWYIETHTDKTTNRYREAEQIAFRPDIAEKEGRVIHGAGKPGFEPRKNNKRFMRIYSKVLEETYANMRRVSLKYRKMSDDELRQQITPDEHNFIVNEAGKRYKKTLIDSWIRNLQAYYSQVVHAHTDIIRAYVMGEKPKYNSINFKKEDSYMYKNLLKTYEYINKKGRKVAYRVEEGKRVPVPSS